MDKIGQKFCRAALRRCSLLSPNREPGIHKGIFFPLPRRQPLQVWNKVVGEMKNGKGRKKIYAAFYSMNY